jgi:hypothetical protein
MLSAFGVENEDGDEVDDLIAPYDQTKLETIPCIYTIDYKITESKSYRGILYTVRGSFQDMDTWGRFLLYPKPCFFSLGFP